MFKVSVLKGPLSISCNKSVLKNNFLFKCLRYIWGYTRPDAKRKILKQALPKLNKLIKRIHYQFPNIHSPVTTIFK